MEREMEKYVLSLLEGYSQTTKILCLMRYELQHINAVSPEEMIEVMALSRKGDPVDSEFPHDAAGIALCFREVAERLNNNAADELATEYIALLSQRDRLYCKRKGNAPERAGWQLTIPAAKTGMFWIANRPGRKKAPRASGNCK